MTIVGMTERIASAMPMRDEGAANGSYVPDDPRVVQVGDTGHHGHCQEVVVAVKDTPTEQIVTVVHIVEGHYATETVSVPYPSSGPIPAGT